MADHAAVLAFCVNERIDLVVVGPEGPLVAGIADSLREGGVAVFGPSRAAAQLEGSKAFTKALCAEHDIPTAAYEHHHDLAAATAALDRFGLPVVVKADGLAAGKGVTVAEARSDAEAALADIFREPGGAVVIEAFLTGEEVSLFVISDGTDIVSFGTAQDHKRVGDGDTGPNTGGMGAYSPATVLKPALEARAMAEIVRPTIAAMAARGTPFVGFLYAGLMLTPDGPRLVEYNVRLGDPEAQVLLPRFDGDLATVLHLAATGRLAQAQVAFADRAAVAVVVAARNYPGIPVTGGHISGLEAIPEETIAFLAGIRREGDALVVSGGRVLAVTGTGPDVESACRRAYSGVRALSVIDGFWRSDIAWRELARINCKVSAPE